MLDLSGRNFKCRKQSIRNFLKSAIVMIALILAVTVLLLTIAGPICESIDRQLAAEKAELSPLAKEMQKRMRGYE